MTGAAEVIRTGGRAAIAVEPERSEIATRSSRAAMRQPTSRSPDIRRRITCAASPRAVGVFAPFLGAYERGGWEATTITLGPGDQLVLYTDGVIDTVGTADRFGEERLARTLCDANGAEMRCGGSSRPWLRSLTGRRSTTPR